MSRPGVAQSGRGVAEAGRGHVALIVAVSLGFAMAMFVAVLATRSSALDKQARSPLLGKPAPTVVGTDVVGTDAGAAGAAGANIVRLSDYRGKYVLVNFFASWCVPCQREHPELRKWNAEHAAKGDAMVLGVIFSDSVANAREFMRRAGTVWPLLDDPGARIALDFGVSGPPESFMVSPDGIVLAKYVGQVTAAGLDSLLLRARQAA